MNYNTNGMEKTLAALHQMLKTAEVNIPSKTAPVLMIRVGQIKKPKTKKRGYQGKGKGKGKAVANKKPLKDAKCFHCDETGHWKRNCAKYLAELKQAKASGGESSGIYVIEIFAFPSKTWVFDTGCGFHICNVLQGLRKIRKLKQGDLEVHVGNGQRVAVKAIGEYVLLLPSGLELVLNNVYYIPSVTRNIVSFHALRRQGFDYRFNGEFISAYFNDIFYFDAKPNNGIYEIEIQNDNILCNISHKRNKLDFNDTYMWHCRLGHKK